MNAHNHLIAAVEALADAERELDRACQGDAALADRINGIEHQDELGVILRKLRSISLDGASSTDRIERDNALCRELNSHQIAAE